MVVRPVVADTLDFHWFVRAARGPPAADGARCVKVCSRAILLAFVSRAKRGKSSLVTEAVLGVRGAGVIVLDGRDS
jgi:hypothetical protein